MGNARNRLLVFVVAVGATALPACASLMTVRAPSDGHVTFTYEGTRAALVLPEAARGRQVSSPGPDTLVYVNELGDDHALVVMFSIWPLPDEQVRSRSGDDLLAWWGEEFERETKTGIARRGDVLRHFSYVGGTRAPAPGESVQCAEFRGESEDRPTEGHRGEPFVWHAREYHCIGTGTNNLVRVHIGERFPADRARLRPSFEEDVDFLFESLLIQ